MTPSQKLAIKCGKHKGGEKKRGGRAKSAVSGEGISSITPADLRLRGLTCYPLKLLWVWQVRKRKGGGGGGGGSTRSCHHGAEIILLSLIHLLSQLGDIDAQEGGKKRRKKSLFGTGGGRSSYIIVFLFRHCLCRARKKKGGRGGESPFERLRAIKKSPIIAISFSTISA